MTDNCCIVCSTPLKVKGTIMSSLLVLTAVATSVLSFTTNCYHIEQLANNSTEIKNDIGTANKSVSISLICFSVMSAIFERYVNKKLVKAEIELEEVKSELAITKAQTNSTRNEDFEHNNEPYFGTPSPSTNRSNESNKTYYPNTVRFIVP